MIALFLFYNLKLKKKIIENIKYHNLLFMDYFK